MTKIVNVLIVYVNSSQKFQFVCLPGATNIVKISEKEKWVYSGYVIAFDVAGSRDFGNDGARNVILFNIDNSSSSHK